MVLLLARPRFSASTGHSSEWPSPEKRMRLLGQNLLAVIKCSILELVLGRALERVGKRLKRLGNGNVENHVGVGDVLLESPQARNSNLLPVKANGEVRLRSGVVLHKLAQRVSAWGSRTPCVAWTDALPSASSRQPPVSRSPRKMETIAGGASFAPRRVIVAGRGNGRRSSSISYRQPRSRGKTMNCKLSGERIAGSKQVLGLGAQRPVVVLARAVDALEASRAAPIPGRDEKR